MRFARFLLTCFLVLSTASVAHAQKFAWAFNAPTVSIKNTIVDREGNVLVVGSIASTTVLGGKEYRVKGQWPDLIAMKIDPQGRIKWVYQTGGTSTEVGQDITVDSNGNSYIIGTWSITYLDDTARIGNLVITSERLRGHFVLKLDSSGMFRWICCPYTENVGGGVTFRIASDPNGNTTYVAHFKDSLTVGPLRLVSPTYSNGYYLARINSLGGVVRAELLGSVDTVTPIDVLCDRSGSVYLSANIRKPWTFRGYTFSHVDSTDIAIAKIAPNGNLLHGWRFGGNGYEQISHVSVDRAENLYFGGSFRSTLVLGSTTLYPVTQTNYFLARCDTAGKVLWAKRAPSVYQYYAFSDIEGNTKLATQFSGTIDIEGTSITSNGINNDVLLLSYNDQGQLSWLLQTGGSDYEVVTAIASDGLGNTYLSGLYNFTTIIGEFVIENPQGAASFLAKLAEPVALTWAPGKRDVCLGNTIPIPFTTNGLYPANTQFSAYLSDAYGKYDSLIQIGKYEGGTDSIIYATIPFDTDTGAGYRVRVSNTASPRSGIGHGPSFSIHALPSLKIEARKPVDFCEGEAVPLLASGGTTYRWSTGDTSASISADQPGWYSVKAFNEHGCETVDSIKLTMYPVPVAGIGANGPTTFCDGGEVTLSATGGKSYTWSTGAKTNSIVVKSSGIYTVKAASAAGCEDISDAMEVIVHPLPEKPIISKEGDQLISSSSIGNQWAMVGGLVTDTTQVFIPRKSGKYYVTVTDSNGCSSTSEMIDVVIQQNSVGDEVLERSLRITPNPMTESLNVSVDLRAPGVISVFDILGRTIYTQDLYSGNNTLQINTTSWTTGSYVLHLSTEGKVVTETIYRK